jgi:Domain of unknown function (DUF4384)/Putative peptidoglycan binding domain
MLRAAIALLAAAVLAGCAATDPRSYKAALEKTPSQSRPVTLPVRSLTNFSTSLGCMDRMMRDMGRPTTYISSKHLGDGGGKTPVAVKELVVTALSEMSRTSGAFRFVDYEIDIGRQDTVQAISQVLLGINKLDLRFPDIYISGGVAYTEASIASRSESLGLSGESGEASVDRSLTTSLVALDLHLGDFRTRTLLPGIHSANSMAMFAGGAGGEIGGRIKKTGIFFNLSRDHAQGAGATLRALVEFGLIELVGKWAQLPYWNCLALPQNHPEFQRQLHSWWAAMSVAERVRLLQTALNATGDYGGPVDGKTSQALSRALAQYQGNQNIAPSGQITFETYEHLMSAYVDVDATGHFMRIGWDRRTPWQDNTRPEMSADFVPKLAPHTPELGATSAQRALGLHVAPVVAGGRPAVGRAMQLNISVQHNANAVCWYQDAAGQILQVFPNPKQPRSLLAARSAVRVPNAAAEELFSIVPEKAGTERALCVAVADGAPASLPASLNGPALRVLKHWPSLDALRAELETSLSGRGAQIAQAQWQVSGP